MCTKAAIQRVKAKFKNTIDGCRCNRCAGVVRLQRIRLGLDGVGLGMFRGDLVGEFIELLFERGIKAFVLPVERMI